MDEPIAVAVIIPVRNEELTVDALLTSLLRQTRRPDQIIVVDAGSTDATCDRVSAYVTTDQNIKLIRADAVYPGVGRNMGVAQAQSEIVAFTDAGIILDETWLENLTRPLEHDASIDVVFGTYEPVVHSYFDECAAIGYVPAPFAVPNGTIRGPFIASSAMRTTAWAKAGGFPPYRAAEDLMFMQALREAELRIAYAPNARCYWSMADGWRATYNRFANYSFHNLVAGRGRYWHRAIFRYYAIGLAALLLTVIHSGFILVPIAGFVARVAKTVLQKRTAFEFSVKLDARRLFCVAGVILTLDAATFVGAFRYAKVRASRKARAAADVPTPVSLQ